MVAVLAHRIVLTPAHELVVSGHGCGSDTFRGMPVALAPSSNGDISDGVVVALPDLGIGVNLVSEGIHPGQHDLDRRGSDPVLEDFAVFENVSGRAALEGGEGDVSSGDGGNVGELLGALSDGLIPGEDGSLVGQTISRTARTPEGGK